MRREIISLTPGREVYKVIADMSLCADLEGTEITMSERR
jgi:hypothetical protein